MFDQIFDDIEEGLKESKKVQFVCLILDKSGSMAGMESVTKEIVDEQLTELLDLSKETNIHTYVIIAMFSNGCDFVMETFDLINQKDIDKCNEFTDKNYKCGGMTALFDSMGKVINTIQKKNDENKDKEIENLVITVSDGLENASIEMNSDSIKKMVDSLESKEDQKWKFVYLGTMESLENARSTNISSLNTMSFSKDPIDMKAKFSSVNASNRAYYTSRVLGADTKDVNYDGSIDFEKGDEKDGTFR